MLNAILARVARQESMSNNLTIGHVYSITDGIFGIVTYRWSGSTKPQLLSRIIPEAANVVQACEILNREFAGEFKPADSDDASWGAAILRARGSVEILTRRQF